MLEEQIKELTAAINRMADLMADLMVNRWAPMGEVTVDPKTNEPDKPTKEETEKTKKAEKQAKKAEKDGKKAEKASKTEKTEKSTDEKQPTHDELQQVCLDIVRKNKSLRIEIREIIDSFGAEFLKQIPEDRLPEVKVKLDELKLKEDNEDA